MITGSTRDEMRSLILARLGDGLGPVTPEQYPQLVGDFYGPDAAAVLAEYPHTRYESPSIALATVLTDEGRTHGLASRWCPTRPQPHVRPCTPTSSPNPPGRPPRGSRTVARHGADMPYFFDSYVREQAPPSDSHARLAETLIGHRTAFARTATPAATGTPPSPGERSRSRRPGPPRWTSRRRTGVPSGRSCERGGATPPACRKRSLPPATPLLALRRRDNHDPGLRPDRRHRGRFPQDVTRSQALEPHVHPRPTATTDLVLPPRGHLLLARPDPEPSAYAVTVQQE